MTVTVNKTTVIENIYKNFYDLIVSISGFTSIVFPVFPATILKDKVDYPVVIVESPEISWDTHTFGKNVLNGTLDVNIYTTTPKDTDQKSSQVNNQIELNKTTLAGLGLRQVSLESTSTDMIPHGKIKVHIKTLTFKYKFYSIKTFAY